MNLRTFPGRAGIAILLTACFAIFGLMTLAAPQQPAGATAAAAPAVLPPAPPTVSGPIKNTTALKDPAHGYPFSATALDLKKTGYVEEEFFIEGKANRYTTSATANATPVDGGNAYKTRIVVRRPASASKFNGTVLVEWTNVSQGHDNEADWYNDSDHIMRSGYAWVGVSAQAVGVQALTQWSPTRYGTLTVSGPAAAGGAGRGGGAGAPGGGGGRGGAGGPRGATPVTPRSTTVALQGGPAPGGGRGGQGGAPGGAPRGGPGGGAPAGGGGARGGAGGTSAVSFDVFAQAALAIRGKSNISVLGPLKAERLIATGHSQSAGQLGIYFNSVHPLAPVYDAVVLHGGGGKMRTDLNVKIFKILSETDVAGLGEAAARQPDSDRYHEWEVAGAGHLDAQVSLGLEREGLLVAGATPVDGPASIKSPTISGGGAGIGTAQVLSTDPNDGCVRPTLTRIPFRYVLASVYDHLAVWVKDGTAPPAAPQIDYANNAIVRDADGNAKGGIQLSQHAVPTAVNRGDNTRAPGAMSGQFCNLIGSYEPFSEAKLAMLYPTHDGYVKTVKEITEKNLKAGYILKPDADATIADANKSSIGKKK